MATISTVIDRNAAFAAALDRALERARYSAFDNHVVAQADGSFTVIDEGDWGALDQAIIDRICHTAPGRMSGLY